MSVFHFDEASHTYTVDGQRLPSVTQIIAPLSAEWLAQIPRDVLEAKRALGTAVHLACELDDLGELDDDDTDPSVMAYVAAWRRFRLDAEVVILANERRLFHPTMRYAGTLDRLVTMKTPAGRETLLVDLKTGAEPHSSYGVQLAAYRLLLEADGVPATEKVGRATVHLSDDGTYRFHRFTNHHDEACFRACLTLHHWKESNK